MSTITAKQLSRTSHPETSKEAAEAIVPHLTELHRWAAKCVRETPGMTQMELGRRHSPDDLRRIGRRLNECVTLGLVTEGLPRKCSESHKRAKTYYPA